MMDSEHEQTQSEIFIIKRHLDELEAHHGGAWKIAFADFMTAMMALFLVLWLISSTSEKTRHTVAQYFNPVKLVDMSTLKKGFRDPKETEMGSGPSVKESELEADSSKPNPLRAGKEEANSRGESKAQIYREAALLREPRAVVAETAAGAPTPATSSLPAEPRSTAVEKESAPDPFATIPGEPERQQESQVPASQSDDASSDHKADRGQTPAAADGASPRQAQRRQHERHDQLAFRLNQASEASGPIQDNAMVPGPVEQQTSREGAKLKASILQALSESASVQSAPRVEVEETAEGILISLTDDATFSMFAVGSDEPQPATVHAVEEIGRILKSNPGLIVIRGHTDGRPYKSGLLYDNWRLSAARAQMALYMLARGGLSEKRVEKIEGWADRRLKSPNNPNGSENRRIEILLRKDKP